MSIRRRHIAAIGGLGALSLGAAAAGASTAWSSTTPAAGLDTGRWAPEQTPVPEPPPEALALTARRTELTLPDLPTLGVPYICLLDLFDDTGAQVGTASADATVIGVTLAGPVVLASVVLQLAEGEIHYQRIMDRFGDFPRTAFGAILGGTGAYRDIRGEVEVSWPDDEEIRLLVQGQLTA